MILEKKRRRDAKDAWLDSIDPLNGLSITQAKSTYNVARRHGSPLLQKIYSEIEACDPTLMTCVERRQSALAGLGWRAVANASAQDESLAEEQRRALEEFANGIENLDEAIEHLDLAFFRGYSVVQPIWQSGTVRRVNLLDSWNFLKDDDGNLLWNPACSLDPKECEVITPAARVVKLVRRRAIDWPALIVYIRKYIGERDWGRFLERYGLPPVDAVMAPNTTDEQRDDYVEAAEAARDGRAVVWPSGTTTSRAEGARGQDPFSPFIEHQEKQIVLMATGGTLTSLAQADTGSLAGGAQMDVWEQIVARDGVVISAVLNRSLFNVYLQERFPGKPLLAHVELGKEDEPSAVEAADLAGKLKAAGYTVDQSQLEESTGLTLVKDEIQPPGGLGGLSLNKKDGKTPLQNDENRLQNAPRNPDGQGDPSGKTPSQNANLGPNNQLKILEAFARDNSPAAKAVAELLQNPGKESAEQLLKDLPTLLPKDPDLAAVIADAMAAEFAKELGGGEMLANKREYKRERDGKFSEIDHPRDFKPGNNPDSAETQAAEIGKGKKAIERCLAEKCDVPNALSRGDVGMISLRYGDEKSGLAHFKDRADALRHLSETLVRGKAGNPYQQGQKLNITHGGYVATLALTNSPEHSDYPKNWVLTSFGPEDKKKKGAV